MVFMYLPKCKTFSAYERHCCNSISNVQIYKSLVNNSHSISLLLISLSWHDTVFSSLCNDPEQNQKINSVWSQLDNDVLNNVKWCPTPSFHAGSSCSLMIFYSSTSFALWCLKANTIGFEVDGSCHQQDETLWLWHAFCCHCNLVFFCSNTKVAENEKQGIPLGSFTSTSLPFSKLERSDTLHINMCNRCVICFYCYIFITIYEQDV